MQFSSTARLKPGIIKKNAVLVYCAIEAWNNSEECSSRLLRDWSLEKFRRMQFSSTARLKSGIIKKNAVLVYCAIEAWNNSEESSSRLLRDWSLESGLLFDSFNFCHSRWHRL